MLHEGLTQQEAQERLIADGPNRLPSDKPRGFFQQVVAVLSEPMLLLLVAAALISFTLGEPLEATILSVGVLLIVSISLLQTRRTDAALAALKSLTAPLARVIRDGTEQRISSELLVVGDLVRILQGDRVPADARVIESANLLLDESNLTGESIAVEKGTGDEIFSSTLLVGGHAVAEVTGTGSSTKVGEIGGLLGRQRDERTPLQRQIDSIVRFVAFLALGAAALVTVTYSLTRNDWLNGALAGIAAAMALLPEELPIVLTVFMGLGALRLSRQRVIVRSSPAIETLGSLTVLCADKTGTITENSMALVDTDEQAIYFGRLASPQQAFDPMDKAFHESAVVPEGWKLVQEYPLTASQLAVAQVWDSGENNFVFALKGAPETVLSLCGVAREFEHEQLELVEQHAQLGRRVLAVASGSWPRANELPETLAEVGFSYLGLAALTDPIRQGVPEAVANLSGAGIRTIMITGDFPGTAVSIARQIGIPDPEKVLTGTEVAELSDTELVARLAEVSVFSRMLPAQKLRLVELLRQRGEIVGMTGDGVNDAPALKQAHVGIAMGERGSEVAREAADLVITDDSFVSIASGIAEGRRIYSNLRRAAAYIIAIHVPIFGLALMPLANPLWPLILLPAQIALLEIIIDPAASVAYQAERASPAQMRQPPRPRIERLISRSVLFAATSQGLVLLLATSSIFLWGLSAGLSDGQVRLLSFTTLLSGNLLLMMTNRSSSESLLRILRYSKNLAAVVIFLIGLLILVLVYLAPGLQEAFRFDPVSPGLGLISALAGLAPVVFNEALKFIQSRRRAA